jgi:tetratricopeptide (TPR) repeat protein
LVASTTEVRQAIPFLPSTRREFSARDKVLAGVHIFRSPALSKDQELFLETSIRDEHGKMVFESRERLSSETGEPLLLSHEIELSDFSPGPYVIDVQARDLGGVVHARKSNIFHVIDSLPTADLPLLADYMDLLETYRSGDFMQARNRLATWTGDRVKDVLEELVLIGEEPSSPEGQAGWHFGGVERRNPDLPPPGILLEPKPRSWARKMRVAALLHTELSTFNAWGLPVETRVLHLEAAEGLVELIPSEKAFARDWFLTVAYFHHGSNLEVSRHYLEEAGRRFPDDAEVLLATGVTYETAAAFDKDRGMFRQAETFYRRAIRADSDLEEAHLRLGKVLLERGGNRAEEAMREFEWVVQHSSDPYLLYLANLFLGDLHKREKRFGRAVECYRAAVDSEPRWQTAHISLSYALRATGDRAAARKVMQKALRLPVDDRNYVDGCRNYSLGQFMKVRQMLNELRQGIME